MIDSGNNQRRSASPTPNPPRRSEPAILTQSADRRQAVNAKAQKFLHDYMVCRGANYFEILGVKQTSGTEEINKAYMAKRDLYHPDRIRGLGNAVAHEKVEELNLLIHKAYSVLINSEEREQYIRKLRSDDSSTMLTPPRKSELAQQSYSEPVDTRRMFERAFAAIREGAFEKAIELLGRLVREDEDGKYRVYLVWAQFLSKQLKSEKAELELKKIAKQHPENVDTFYVLGSLCLKEQRNKEAIFWFEKVLKLEPQNIDATRQLRLIRMRANSEVSGLFEMLKLKK